MKIVDIIERIDQKEADEVLKSLVSSGDPAAKFFQQTRYDPRHTSIDSAQRAAERMSHAEQKRKSSQERPKDSPTTQTPSVKYTPIKKDKPSAADSDWSDDFYGNRYTGSLNKGRSYEPGDLSRLMGIDPDSFLGRAAGAVSKVKKPVSTLAKAFKIGVDSATKR